MSDRLQVLISPELNAQIRKAARRDRVSKGEWVRRALQD
jgi:predicted HicB family RNase H-like nuclease